MQFLKKWIAMTLPPEINFRMNDQNRLVKQAGPAQGYRRMARISVGDRAFFVSLSTPIPPDRADMTPTWVETVFSDLLNPAVANVSF